MTLYTSFFSQPLSKMAESVRITVINDCTGKEHPDFEAYPELVDMVTNKIATYKKLYNINLKSNGFQFRLSYKSKTYCILLLLLS